MITAANDLEDRRKLVTLLPSVVRRNELVAVAVLDPYQGGGATGWFGGEGGVRGSSWKVLHLYSQLVTF